MCSLDVASTSSAAPLACMHLSTALALRHDKPIKGFISKEATGVDTTCRRRHLQSAFSALIWKRQNNFSFRPRIVSQKAPVLFINSVQTRCIVKGEAQKSPLFWRFSGGFWFSQDRVFSKNSTRKPLNLIKSPIFTNTPCKSSFLYNAPSMRTVLFSQFET